MDLNDLFAFSLVAQHGTISAAARELKVPKSTVSRRVQRLEDALSVELLRRTPRSVSLTDDGIALYRRTAPPLRDLWESSDALAKHQIEPSGRLRITTVPDFGQSPGLVSLITNYALEFPKVTVDLNFSYRAVNLVEEGYDVAFRLHPGAIPPDASLIARHVATFRGGFYVSPDYVHPDGIPTDATQLANHPIAISAPYPGARVIEGFMGVEPGEFTPRWQTNDFGVVAQITSSGTCVGALPSFISERLVSEGKLVRILPECVLQEGYLSMIWPASRHLTPRVQTFVDHAVQQLDDMFE